MDAHFDTFLEIYPEVYERDNGFLRPIIPEVVEKFMGCGDFAKGFARVRCDHCKHDDLPAFSCKGRWFCPSCHQKKAQLFGALPGCCARGMPLAARIKAMGRQAIHIGGSLQLFFGIRGERWEDRADISRHFNEHWIPPHESERPASLHRVEGGCCW